MSISVSALAVLPFRICSLGQVRTDMTVWLPQQYGRNGHE